MQETWPTTPLSHTGSNQRRLAGFRNLNHYLPFVLLCYRSWFLTNSAIDNVINMFCIWDPLIRKRIAVTLQIVKLGYIFVFKRQRFVLYSFSCRSGTGRVLEERVRFEAIRIVVHGGNARPFLPHVPTPHLTSYFVNAFRKIRLPNKEKC